MAQTGTSESEDAYRAYHYFRFTLGANVARQVVNAFMKYLAGRKWTSAYDAGAMWESLMFGGEIFNFDAPVDPRAVEHPEDPMGDDRCGTLWLVKWLDESCDPSNTRVRRLRVVHSKRYGIGWGVVEAPVYTLNDFRRYKQMHEVRPKMRREKYTNVKQAPTGNRPSYDEDLRRQRAGTGTPNSASSITSSAPSSAPSSATSSAPSYTGGGYAPPPKSQERGPGVPVHVRYVSPPTSSQTAEVEHPGGGSFRAAEASIVEDDMNVAIRPAMNIARNLVRSAQGKAQLISQGFDAVKELGLDGDKVAPGYTGMGVCAEHFLSVELNRPDVRYSKLPMNVPALYEPTIRPKEGGHRGALLINRQMVLDLRGHSPPDKNITYLAKQMDDTAYDRLLFRMAAAIAAAFVDWFVASLIYKNGLQNVPFWEAYFKSNLLRLWGQKWQRKALGGTVESRGEGALFLFDEDKRAWLINEEEIHSIVRGVIHLPLPKDSPPASFRKGEPSQTGTSTSSSSSSSSSSSGSSALSSSDHVPISSRPARAQPTSNDGTAADLGKRNGQLTGRLSDLQKAPPRLLEMGPRPTSVCSPGTDHTTDFHECRERQMALIRAQHPETLDRDIPASSASLRPPTYSLVTPPEAGAPRHDDMHHQHHHRHQSSPQDPLPLPSDGSKGQIHLTTNPDSALASGAIAIAIAIAIAVRFDHKHGDSPIHENLADRNPNRSAPRLADRRQFASLPATAARAANSNPAAPRQGGGIVSDAEQRRHK
ncbi:hypothetical protein VTG60DRAFT_5335 [Thermothelomyces hinnuleus]